MIHATETLMWSDVGSHTAYQAGKRPGGWVVSWLPRRVLDGRQAWLAMHLADIYCARPEPGSAWWGSARELERELGVSPRVLRRVVTKARSMAGGV